jgi:D-methionine transport system permease protein
MNDRWATYAPLLWKATGETLNMVGIATVVTVALGLPLGVLLVATERGGLFPIPLLNRVLATLVDIGRSFPFIILLVAVIPLTRLLVGTTIGSRAAIVPLTISAIPFFARIVETALRGVDRGLIEAATAMGASRLQVVSGVLVREALPSLVSGLAITVIGIVGYSAMAGAVGGGGLGDLAIRYGYQRFQTDVTIATVVLLIVIVQAIQLVGSFAARRLSHK